MALAPTAPSTPRRGWIGRLPDRSSGGEDRRGRTRRGELGAICAGLALGAGTASITWAATGTDGSRHPATLALLLLSSVVNSFWAWAWLPFVIGRRVCRRGYGATATVSTLLAVVGYYVTEACSVAGPLETRPLLRWCVVAVVGAPVMAVLGRGSCQRGILGLLSALVPAALMTWSALVHPSIWPFVADAARATVLLLATLLALSAVARWRREVLAGRSTEAGPDSTESPAIPSQA